MSPAPTRRAAVAWILAGLYLGLIWVGSSMSSDEVPSIGRLFYDKVMHCAEFTVLGFLLTHALMATFPGRPMIRIALTAWLAAVGWGVLDEMHQAFVPGRSSEILDLLADAVGAALGTGIRCAFATLRRWRARPPSPSASSPPA